MKDIKKIQEFFSKPLEENTWPEELTSRYSDEYRFELEKVTPTYQDKPGKAKYRVIDIESGELKGTPVFGSISSLQAFADDLIKPQGGTQSTNLGEIDAAIAKLSGRKEMTYDQAINEYDVYMPSQEEVDKFFALTNNETHYLNSKPVMGQEGTFNLMPIEPWDEYDYSNWKALVRKAKAKGKSINEVKVDYDFSERELIRVLRQLKRGASTEIDMIKAFTKALGRDITKDELFSESLNENISQEVVNKVSRFITSMANYYDYSEQDAVYAIMQALRAHKGNFQGLNEASKGAMNYFSDLKFNYQKAFRYLDVEEREEYKRLAKDFFSKLQVDDKVRAVGLNEAKKEDKIDIVTMDVPLFIRALEYAKEDAQEDMDLHDFAEKAIAATKEQGILQMDDYDMLVGGKEPIDESVNLKQSKLSSSEYQKAKKLKAFDAKDWKWNADEDLYIKVVNESVDSNKPEKSPGQKYDKNKFANLMGRKVVYSGIPGTIVYADENMLKLKDKNNNIRKINYNMFTNQGFIKEILSNL